MMQHPRTANGFTLIELIVVIVILGVLSTIVIQAVGDRPDQARLVKVRNDLMALEGALGLYRLDNLALPSQSQSLMALVERPDGLDTWRGPYVDRLPNDPWGNAYLYRTPGRDGRLYDLISLGQDGVAGGTDLNADIRNWDLE